MHACPCPCPCPCACACACACACFNDVQHVHVHVTIIIGSRFLLPPPHIRCPLNSFEVIHTESLIHLDVLNNRNLYSVRTATGMTPLPILESMHTGNHDLHSTHLQRSRIPMHIESQNLPTLQPTPGVHAGASAASLYHRRAHAVHDAQVL